MKTFQDFLHIMGFIGNQTAQGPNESFIAASTTPLISFLLACKLLWYCLFINTYKAHIIALFCM